MSKILYKAEKIKSWDNLSMSERLDMIRAALNNGITKLEEIKKRYNEYAEGDYLDDSHTGVLPAVEVGPEQKAYGGNLFKGGGRKSSGSSNPTYQKAMRYFMSKGLAQHQAAGLVGNLIRESRLNPQALNSSSKALGIAQWLGPRKKALIAKYGNNPTLDQQLEFVWHELNTSHKRGLTALRNSKDAAEAARNAMGYYEFSAGPEAAIAAMHKHGQNGTKSMQQGINFASMLNGTPVPDTTGEIWEGNMERLNQSIQAPTLPTQSQMPTFIPYNEQLLIQGYQPPIIEEEPEQPLIQAAMQYSPEEIKRQEKRQEFQNFMNVLGMLNSGNQENDFTGTLGLLTGSPSIGVIGNMFAGGGNADK